MVTVQAVLSVSRAATPYTGQTRLTVLVIVVVTITGSIIRVSCSSQRTSHPSLRIFTSITTFSEIPTHQIVPLWATIPSKVFHVAEHFDTNSHSRCPSLRGRCSLQTFNKLQGLIKTETDAIRSLIQVDPHTLVITAGAQLPRQSHGSGGGLCYSAF